MVFLKIIEFFVSYDIIILPVLFLLVWVFGLVNWVKNVYRSQNKKLETCRACIVRNPKFVGVFVASLPEEYRRQWRAFVNSNASRPSKVFEFVPRKNKTLLVELFVICTLVSAVYLTAFVLNTAHREYVVFQFAFWLAFVVVMLVDMLIFAKKEKRARQIFGKFVAQLNATEMTKQALEPKTVAQKLDMLKTSETTDETLQKATQILRENGNDLNRTADEQREINQSLNGLLQAYSQPKGI